jgi:hypothetical protein
MGLADSLGRVPEVVVVDVGVGVGVDLGIDVSGDGDGDVRVDVDVDDGRNVDAGVGRKLAFGLGHDRGSRMPDA